MQVRLNPLSPPIVFITTTVSRVYFKLKHTLEFIKARLAETSTWLSVSAATGVAYQYKDDPFTRTVVLLIGVAVAMVPNKKKPDEAPESQ